MSSLRLDSWKQEDIAAALMVSLAVIMRNEFGNGTAKRDLAKEDQFRQAFLLDERTHLEPGAVTETVQVTACTGSNPRRPV